MIKSNITEYRHSRYIGYSRGSAQRTKESSGSCEQAPFLVKELVKNMDFEVKCPGSNLNSTDFR
jgi:hypothetical protein